MTPLRIRPASAGVSTLALVAALGAACSSGDAAPGDSSSGQTGSPVYESPGSREPGSGGNDGEGGPSIGDAAPEVVPEPPPTPGDGALVGSTLLLAAGDRLALFDVSTPRQPRAVGGLALGGSGRLIAAASLERVLVVVVGRSSFQSAEIPAAPVPARQARLLEIDASDPAAPVVVASANLPDDATAVVPLDDGFSLVGGRVEQRPRSCGGGEIAIDFGPRAVESLSAARWVRQGDTFAQTASRELPAGEWHVAGDAALRTTPLRGASASTPVELELVDLQTLETRQLLQQSFTELGSPEALRVTRAGELLLIAGGTRLLGFEIASGTALEPLAAPEALPALGLLPGGELVALGSAARPLARIDRSTSPPTLRFVPVTSGAPIGALQPFGDGFVTLGSTGSASGARLRIETYALSAAGELSLEASLQTDWRADATPRIDAASARIAVSMPVDDVDSGRLGLVERVAGQLVASTPVATELVAPAWLTGDAALTFAQGLLQPVAIDASNSGSALSAEPPITVALRNVRQQLEHAGLTWTVHRKDTGETSLSVRAGDAEPTFVDLPHAVEQLVPLSDNYLAVMGLSESGQCDALREQLDGVAECRERGNGVSILAAESGGARVVASLSLGSFLEGRPTIAGVEQTLDWNGYFALEPGKLALVGSFRESCSSQASCDQLGVPAYTSYGSAGCSSDATECPTGIQTFVSGSRSETRLFELDVTDPEAPRLEPAAHGGGQQHLYEAPNGDLSGLLLQPPGGGGLWAYAVEEPIYGPDGNGVLDDQGHALTRWYVQTIRDVNGSPSFDEQVNVPGRVVAMLDGEGRDLVSLEPSFDDADRQHVLLRRLELRDGQAFVASDLDVGEFVDAGRASEGLLPLLRLPAEFCAGEGAFELVVADLRASAPRLSSPLALPGPPEFGWGFSSYEPAPSEPGVAYLFGGPALGGRLTVDLTSNPPRVVAYEIVR